MGGSTPAPAPPERDVPVKRWPAGRIIAVVLMALGVLWFAFAGRILVSSDDDPPRADAVVALSGDPLGARLRKAVDVLLETGSGRLVAFVDGQGSIYDQRQAAMTFLQEQGVDPAAIRLLPSGASTADEAAAVAGLAERCGWGSVTVVTSPYHTRRTGWLFGRIVDADITTVSSDERFVSGAWFTDGPSTEVVFVEWMKLVSSLRYLFAAPDPVDPSVEC